MFVPQTLLALAAVIVVGRLLARLLKRAGQPPVIGEVIAGIVLGPSLLGWLAPGVFSFVMTPGVASLLGVIAQLGVILYMFLVGLELDADGVRGQARTTVTISLVGIALPFVLGMAFALFLAPRFSNATVPLASFALFIGVAMSITAFPVLARILADRGITKTPLGMLALAAAAIGDVTAWCLLALVVGIVKADGRSVAWIVVLTLAFIGLVLTFVRPVVVRLIERMGSREPGALTVVMTIGLALVAAFTTEAIGVHALFGAFLFGAIVPHDSRLAQLIHRSLEPVVLPFLLPAFFALAGLRTDIGLLSEVNHWLVAGLIILIATLGKFGGTFLAARLSGLDARFAAGLGVLMNTRGLMELIVLNVGLEVGVISPTLYTMFVIMALTTTMATTPILGGIYKGQRAEGEGQKRR